MNNNKNINLSNNIMEEIPKIVKMDIFQYIFKKNVHNKYSHYSQYICKNTSTKSCHSIYKVFLGLESSNEQPTSHSRKCQAYQKHVNRLPNEELDESPVEPNKIKCTDEEARFKKKISDRPENAYTDIVRKINENINKKKEEKEKER
jgi:hypothetical protein